MSATEPTPIRSPLDVARGYLANTQAVAHAERDPDQALQLQLAGGAANLQHSHATLARTFALVSLAESMASAAKSLDRIAMALSHGVER